MPFYLYLFLCRHGRECAQGRSWRRCLGPLSLCDSACAPALSSLALPLRPRFLSFNFILSFFVILCTWRVLATARRLGPRRVAPYLSLLALLPLTPFAFPSASFLLFNLFFKVVLSLSPHSRSRPRLGLLPLSSLLVASREASN